MGVFNVRRCQTTKNILPNARKGIRMNIGSAPSSASRHSISLCCIYIVFVTFFSLVGVTTHFFTTFRLAFLSRNTSWFPRTTSWFPRTTTWFPRTTSWFPRTTSCFPRTTFSPLRSTSPVFTFWRFGIIASMIFGRFPIGHVVTLPVWS